MGAKQTACKPPVILLLHCSQGDRAAKSRALQSLWTSGPSSNLLLSPPNRRVIHRWGNTAAILERTRARRSRGGGGRGGPSASVAILFQLLCSDSCLSRTCCILHGDNSTEGDAQSPGLNSLCFVKKCEVSVRARNWNI